MSGITVKFHFYSVPHYALCAKPFNTGSTLVRVGTSL